MRTMNRLVVCLCPIAWRQGVVLRLNAEVGPNWPDQGAIRVIWLTNRQADDVQYIQREVDSFVNRGSAGDILLVGSVKYTGSLLPSDTTVVRKIKDPQQFGDRIGRICAFQRKTNTYSNRNRTPLGGVFGLA